MGCSICMDDFDEAADSQRPTALPCGHIFHHGCVQSWFYGSFAASTSMPNKQRCPLCAVPTQAKSMMRLYPSEGNDLNRYLQAYRSSHSREAVADDRETGEDKDCSDHLLDALMQFHNSLQAFVMSTHSDQIARSASQGSALAKHVQTLCPGKDKEGQTDLQSALEALSQLQTTCEAGKKAVEKRRRDLSRSLEKAKNDSKAASALLAQAKEGSAKQERIKIELSREMTQMQELQKVRQKEEAVLRERAARADSIDAELRTRRRAMEQERKQEAFNTSTKISMIESKTREEIAAMQTKVMLAEQKARDAERQCQATQEKNNLLAKQMREMKERLSKQSKTIAVPPSSSPASPSVGSAATIRRKDAEICALKEALSRAQYQVPVSVARTPTTTARQGERIIDLTQSRTSSPTNAKSGSDEQKKRARMGTLLIEPENLDLELDEDLFPMPGFMRSAAVHPAREPLNSVQTTVAGSKNSSSVDAHLLDRISSKSGVVLGRKRRPPL